VIGCPCGASIPRTRHAVAPARGFGDAEVADELLKRALAAPILAELEEQWI
jgi:hypothetical protein